MNKVLHILKRHLYYAKGGRGAQLVNPLGDLFIATVAFNNPSAIAHQIRLLRKYLKDSYTYMVFDNSSVDESAEHIRVICKDNDTPYYRLPKSPYNHNPSLSHGGALNWIYKNYIRPRRLEYFGFIDHDIYPYRQTSILEPLKEHGLFGFKQRKKDKWYYWPGFSFFSRRALKHGRLNFMPGNGLDTGGSNWKTIYRYHAINSLPRLRHRLTNIRKGSSKQADKIEYIGDWAHTINASGWSASKDKEPLVEEFLAKL